MGPAREAVKSSRGPRARSGNKVLVANGAFDEVWVIQKSGQRKDRREDRTPTQGELRAILPGEPAPIPLPLKHTDVKAKISAFIATVTVTQKYENPYAQKIEAVYVFPLPHNAAVTDFLMVIGERRIRGMIRERREALRIYEQAKAAGYVASLLTQERPNIFTQRVANIEPKKAIDIQITYFNALRYENGEYEFVFPMVVGPRFNPPGYTKGIGAVAIGKYKTSGQPVEVGYLKPGQRSGHDIAVSVEVDAGVPIEAVRCRSHVVDVKRPEPHRAVVTLSSNDAIPNKDFALRFRVAGKRLKTALLTNSGKHGRHFALVLQPPVELNYLKRMPREMVFVLDCSGSMRGWPIERAKATVRRCLKRLDSNDTFQIIRFSSRASQLGPAPVPATPRNIRRALSYLDTLNGSGGTMMIKGIEAALDFPHDDRRLRIVSFLTDGYIGNEAQIFAAVHRKLGAARIFSFGVGSSTNRHLLAGLARIGRGAVAFVGPGDGTSDVVDLWYERAAHPALTDVEIDWGGMQVKDVYPRRTPDLFAGAPVLITGEFIGDGKTTVRIKGRAGTGTVEYKLVVDLDDENAAHPGITSIWARQRLRELADAATRRPSDELRGEMTQVSLTYRVQCAYTAFLAVDALRKTSGSEGTTVAVPVPMPEGVKYETTVQ